MIHSMTGFGKAEGIAGGKKINIQIKSLNSKQADISVKLPSLFKEQEVVFRKRISSQLTRGKIELYLSFEAAEEALNYEVNESVFEQYFQQVSKLQQQHQLSNSEVLASILRMPEVVKNKEAEVSDEDAKALLQILDQAISSINTFRADEGKSLENDLSEHVQAIESLLEDALQYEDERIQIVRNRLENNLAETQQKEKVDADRFEQEMIYYMEKYDISEEKVRLKSHCDYFTKCMKEEEKQGRKLGFIAQEIGREINTLGSKANHAQMQKLVVQMKDRLEKIKEQVLNVL